MSTMNIADTRRHGRDGRRRRLVTVSGAAALAGAIVLSPAFVAPASAQVGSVAQATVAQPQASSSHMWPSDYRRGYRHGFRDGSRDGWSEAKRDCKRENRLHSRVQSGSEYDRGYIDGYDRGFELGFDRGIEHFCKRPRPNWP